MVAPDERKVNAAPDWDAQLGRPQSECAECRLPFTEGSEYVTVLRFERPELRRHELCPECHERTAAESFAFWRARIARADEHRRRPLDMGFLVEFFRRLHLESEQADERLRQVGYIVALILVRKKVLTLIRTDREAEDEILVLRFAKEPDQAECRIVVPTLTEDRIAAIKDELTRIFNIDEQAGVAKATGSGA